MLNEEEPDYYEVLGVEPKADVKLIRAAYYRLAQTFHPDKNSSINSDQFQRISKAYTALSDPSLRAAYDSRRFLKITANSFLDKISLSEFEERELRLFYYSCRCGGLFQLGLIDDSDLQSSVVVNCDSCSIQILVEP